MFSYSVRCALAFSILLLTSADNHAQQDNKAPEYTINFDQHNRNYLVVTAVLEPTGNVTELMLPVWTPGSYLVREYSRHIDSFFVSDESNQPLDWKKTKKNRWEIESKEAKKIKISYRLYCNDLSVRTNFVDGEFALVNGAATFVTIPENRKMVHKVKLELPNRWNRSATSLQQGEGKHEYLANSYDELVDSPIVAGNISVHPFVVSDVPHQLVNIGDSTAWDGAAAASDLKKMVLAHHEMWQIVPYKKYLFLNVICDRGGGLEHDNSTVMMTGAWTYRVKDRYTNWLSLASHEFFHTWNIRRLRPKALVNYDYENEVYTPSLWIGEGITSYYEDLFLVRCGLMSKKEFLKRLNNNIESVQTRPGRLKQSLRASSFDTWIKFYRPSANSSDTQVSYYSKGAVVGFLLDVEIRKATRGEKSLDDVMRKMYGRYSKTGYTEDEFRNVVSDVAGIQLEEFFHRNVDSADELDFENAKLLLGLKFPHDEDKQEDAEKESDEANEANPSNEADSEEKASSTETNERTENVEDEEKTGEPVWLGFRLSGNSIRSIRAESPAEQAGLNNGDELLAIDGYRIQGKLNERLEQYNVGNSLELLISRRQKIMKRTIIAGSKPEEKKWRLEEVSKPTDNQKQQLESWLGIEQED